MAQDFDADILEDIQLTRDVIQRFLSDIRSLERRREYWAGLGNQNLVELCDLELSEGRAGLAALKAEYQRLTGFPFIPMITVRPVELNSEAWV